MPFRLGNLPYFVFRRPSRILREINSRALMATWANDHQTENIFGHRFQLYEFLNSSTLRSQSIDYLEFGVFTGVSIFKWAEINKNGDSRFYGFDSFEGLPEPWDLIGRPIAKGAMDAGGQIPSTEDRRIQFIKGLFQETLRPFLQHFDPQNRIVLHCDCDLYTSTLYCLTQTDWILREGSIVIFDDFFSSSHQFQAFLDYVRAYRRNYHVVAAVSQHPYSRIALQFD